MRQPNKIKHLPVHDTPGVHALGRNELGHFSNLVVTAESSGVSNADLESFYNYKLTAEPENALSIFLKMFFHYYNEVGAPIGPDEQEELFKMAMLFNNLNFNSAAGIREDLEELQKEFEQYRQEHEPGTNAY